MLSILFFPHYYFFPPAFTALSIIPPLLLLVPHQDVREEEEGQPVGQHLLSHRLRPPQQQLGVGLGNRLAHQLGQESLKDSAGKNHEGVNEAEDSINLNQAVW